jgi:hypothetical protein
MRGIDWAVEEKVRQRLNWGTARARGRGQKTKSILVDVEETVACKKLGGDRIGTTGQEHLGRVYIRKKGSDT